MGSIITIKAMIFKRSLFIHELRLMWWFFLRQRYLLILKVSKVFGFTLKVTFFFSVDLSRDVCRNRYIEGSLGLSLSWYTQPFD